MYRKRIQSDTAMRNRGRWQVILAVIACMVVSVFAREACSESGLRTFYTQVDPDGHRPRDHPDYWDELDPNGVDAEKIYIPAGESIWFGIENDYVYTNIKVFHMWLLLSPPSDAKHLGGNTDENRPQAGGYTDDGTPIPVPKNDIAVKTNDFGWVYVYVKLDPQPEWEWIKLTNSHTHPITFKIVRVRTDTECIAVQRCQSNESGEFWVLDVLDASFGVDGWMVNDTRITQIEIYPERCTVDAAAEPYFSADPETGQWFPEYTFIDPRGDFRPTGGLRWVCVGEGLAAQQHYQMSVPLIGEADTMYEMFAWDEDAGEYLEFVMNLGGLPWVETFRHYFPENGMHGQWGWEGWDDDVDFDAFTSDVHAYSDTLSVDIQGDADLVYPFAGADSGKWVFSTQVYVPEEMLETSFFLLLNTYPTDPDHPQHWSLQLELNGAEGVLRDYLHEAAAPLIRNKWTEIRVEIDLDQDEQTVYYAGAPLLTKGWTDGVAPGGALNIGAVDLYAAGASSVYYDDLVLEHGEMSPCPADLDGDGAVGTSDLLMLLAAWGEAGPGDLDGDGLVGTGDLLQLLAAWGECP
jgi:hypothetical protein